MKQFIYADNAATAQLNKSALEAMIPWLTEEYGNASQPYSFACSAKNALKEARESIAQCIDADPQEIYFTSGGTESDNWAIKGSAFADSEKRVTITSAIEHHAVLNSCASIERLGYPVAYVYPQEDGVITPEALEAIITDKTRLVSIMFSNNEIGTIQPIQKLAAIAHSHGAIFHTDAVQAVGHIPIDVKELDVDMLSASAHKFNGPKGIGFLYIKQGTSIEPLLDGGNQEFGSRAGTENIASIVGMAKALQINCQSLSKSSEHLLKLERLLQAILTDAGIDYRRNGSQNHIPGNISLSFKGFQGEALLHRLDLMGICVSTGSACDSINTQLSHVISAINVPEEYAYGTIRISLGKDNTADEVESIGNALIKIIHQH